MCVQETGCGTDAEPIAVLEFGLEARLCEAGFDGAGGVVLDVVEARAPRELADRSHCGPRAVLRGGERPAEVVTTEKPDLGIEVATDQKMIDLEGVEIAVVGEGRLVARVVSD